MTKTMTLEDLNRGLELEKAIKEQEEILETMKAKAYRSSSQQLDGMPHTTGINDRTGYYGAIIADLEASIEEQREEQRQAMEEIAAYIRTVDNKRIRCIMRLRFLCLLLWKEVAAAMGQYYTEETVRRSTYRWLRMQAASCSPNEAEKRRVSQVSVSET